MNERLTKKLNDGYISSQLLHCEHKLGQLEDIEEEYAIIDNNDLKRRLSKADKYGELSEQLGIDLGTLFDALKNGIIVCCNNTFGGERNVFVRLTPDRLSIEYKWKCLRKRTQKFYFKDYGKTWALTKEELL